MKGVSNMMIAIVILLILGVILLAIFVWWLWGGKGSLDIAMNQNVLRQCCDNYRINNCNVVGTECAHPDGQMSMSDLARLAAIDPYDEIDDFCANPCD